MQVHGFDLKEKISVVIVGLSGAGKTTLIEALRPYFDFTHLSYGQFVARHGVEDAPAAFQRAFEDAPTQLVIMDEHLEYEHDDEDQYLKGLAEVYKAQNVRAVAFLEVDPHDLIIRHENDRTSGKRLRDLLAISELESQHALAKRRSFKMQKLCGLRFLFLKNTNLEKSTLLAKRFIEETIQLELLRERQQVLSPYTVPFDLPKTWNSYWLMRALRKEVKEHVDALLQKAIEEDGVLFDPQDLEHQALFYLTTWEPAEITEDTIRDAVFEQHHVVVDRMVRNLTPHERNYLFRGLTKFYPDLNVRPSDRLVLVRDGKELYARGSGRKFKVLFRELLDDRMIQLYTDTLHYIHCSRSGGRAFGLFFEGDQYPFAVQSLELTDRDYKKEALLYAGLNPNKVVEITRMYTLPGSPRNIASIMDGLIRRQLKSEGIEAMITTVMPAYAKTKGTTVAGGMSVPFLVKKLEHVFYKNEKGLWEHVVERRKDQFEGSDHRHSAASWQLPPVVEVVHVFSAKTTFTNLLPDGVVVYRDLKPHCHDLKKQKISVTSAES